MIVTEEQYRALQNHLVIAWLKWAETYRIKICIAVYTDIGQELYILGPHIKIYPDAIIVHNKRIAYSEVAGLYTLDNKPILQTENVEKQ